MSRASRVLALLVILAVVATPAAFSYAQSEPEYTIATVVKLAGDQWFIRMEEGVQQFNEDFPNVNAFQQGPSRADAAMQVQVIEDLLAQGVDALCVIPFQPEALEAVLARARAEGVVVVTHEASNQQNIDWDIEAFDNASYGIHLMDAMAERMGYQGRYAVMVGSLTSTTHNEWVDAAIAHQRENYPDMEWTGDKIETFDDAQTAYERTQELLIAYPDLRGVQGSSSLDVLGAGQAIEEAGLEDQIVVVGTGLPSEAGALIETGAVDLISFWDPALAGYACNLLALMTLQGEIPPEAYEGELPEDFGLVGIGVELTGYEVLSLVDRVFFGLAWIDVTIENLDEWDL